MMKINHEDTLWTDLETYSEVNLSQCGAYRYAEDPSTEIMLWAYAMGDEDPVVWDLTEEPDMPAELKYRQKHARRIGTHNGAMFDRLVIERSPWAWYLYKKELYDTMVKAYMHSLPGALGTLSVICKLPEDQAKQKTGKGYIRLFCMPCPKNWTIRRATRITHPNEWRGFKAYAGNDITSMRLVDRKTPSWNMSKSELDLWRIDLGINDIGMPVDLDLANAAIEADEREKKERNRITAEKTDNEVQAASQAQKMLEYVLKAYGVDLPNMQKATIQRRAEDESLPEELRELLRIRLDASSTASSKYKPVVRSVCQDGRVHGGLQFCAAFRTGRWGGRLIQPQNFARPKRKAKTVELGISFLKKCYDTTKFCFGSIKSVVNDAIRGVIAAPEGKKLVVSDLSAIEGRVIAWLAGEDWKVKAYSDFDNGHIPYDMYKITYANTFGIGPDEVGKWERQIGKVLELAQQYGGGAGAFVSAAATYRIDLNEITERAKPSLKDWAVRAAQNYYPHAVETGRDCGLPEETFIVIDAIKRMWRDKNSNIEQFWWDLENAWRTVLKNPKRRVKVGYITVDKKGIWLRMKLPSGRYLSYPGAQLGNDLTYLGMNSYSKKWCRLKTYGGKLAENVTQAVARDVLADGMKRAVKENYMVILTVHDELVTETPDTEEYNVRELNALLAENSGWNIGLPLAADGFEAYRYKKE